MSDSMLSYRSEPTLRQTLDFAMRSLRDVGPLVALYPSEDNFSAADRGQRVGVIAWSEVYVYTRVESGGLLGASGWSATPRNPVPHFSQMLQMGYT